MNNKMASSEEDLDSFIGTFGFPRKRERNPNQSQLKL